MYTRGVPGSVHESVLDAIGATPLIRLRRVTEGLAPAIYVKAEWQNAGGSVKDRAALWMIRAAERSGALGPSGVIVEGTSGNTGIGLALVGGFLGYRTLIVVPDTTAAEKIAALRAYGAEVVLTPGGCPATTRATSSTWRRGSRRRLPAAGSPTSTATPRTPGPTTTPPRPRSGSRPAAA